MSTRKEDDEEEKKSNFPWGWVIFGIAVVIVIAFVSFGARSNVDESLPQKEDSINYIEELNRINENSKKLHGKRLREINKRMAETKAKIDDNMNKLY